MEIKETKTNKWIFYLIIFGLVMVIISMYTCNGNKETDKANVPATSGKTPVAVPKQEPLVVVKDSLILKYIPASDKDYNFWKSQAEKLQKESNDKKVKFENANDSLRKLLYAKETEPKEYLTEWDNDTINAKVFGMNTGEINSMQLKYIIKERKQEVKVPKTVFRLLLGGGIGANKELNQGILKANISGQLKNGNVLRLSYEKMGNQDYGLIEYDISIFNFKK